MRSECYSPLGILGQSWSRKRTNTADLKSVFATNISLGVGGGSQ